MPETGWGSAFNSFVDNHENFEAFKKSVEKEIFEASTKSDEGIDDF